MGKHHKNTNTKSFLKEDFKDTISKKHSSYLGTDIPEGYFKKSKVSILDKIKQDVVKETSKKQKVFKLKPNFKYAIAASVVCLLSLTVWLQTLNNGDIENTNIELLSFQDDVLINAIMVSDADLDSFTETTLINEIVIKAEISEQQIDDLFINSLFVEDSLIDNYTKNNFVDKIIL